MLNIRQLLLAVILTVSLASNAWAADTVFTTTGPNDETIYCSIQSDAVVAGTLVDTSTFVSWKTKLSNYRKLLLQERKKSSPNTKKIVRLRKSIAAVQLKITDETPLCEEAYDPTTGTPTPIPTTTATPVTSPTKTPTPVASTTPTSQPTTTPTVAPTTSATATKTPTPSPTQSTTVFDSSGNTTAYGNSRLGIPSGLTGNKTRGSTLSATKACTSGCHSEKLNRTYSQMLASFNNSSMAAIAHTNQDIADLAAWSNRSLP